MSVLKNSEEFLVVIDTSGGVLNQRGTLCKRLLNIIERLAVGFARGKNNFV